MLYGLGKECKEQKEGEKRPGFATSSDLLLLLFCFVYRSLNTSQDYTYGFVGHVLGSAEYSEI